VGDLFRVKAAFFDKAAAVGDLDANTRKKLNYFGARVRRRAKSSLKYKDGPAPPGRPPHVHRSASFKRRKGKKGKKPQPVSPLRELTFYSYDRASKSVVIGPAIGGSRSGAPRTLEEGGTARVAGRTVTIRPRPTMEPAFRVELNAVGGDFRNIVTKK
jgi:hypothetical protein